MEAGAGGEGLSPWEKGQGGMVVARARMEPR
jgi:hypothetical protein